MKRFKKVLIFLSIMLFLPLFLFACGETTFETTPWLTSSKTEAEVTDEVENCRNYMMDEVHIPVTYETTTTYNFFDTEDENFSNKTVKKVTTATFSSANIEDATAKYTTKTYEDGVLQSLEESTYVRTSDNSGFAYTVKTTYALSSDEEDTVFRERQEAEMVDRTFYTMLGEIIFEAQENEADNVSEKTFDEVQYYKLSSNISNLNETIQDKFIEKSDLFTAPELFSLNKKGDDYVMPFSYEYGITKLDYISFFALNYTVSNSNDTIEGDFETYLSVSSVTVLKEYGNAVQIASEPENIDEYTIATFDNIVKSDEYYVVYKQGTDAENYVKTTAQKQSDGDLLVKVENIVSGSPTIEYYFLDYEGDNFTAYLINVDEQTYTVQESFAPFFLNFDYSLEFFLKTSDGAYQYGSNEAYYLIRMEAGEVYSITNSKADDATILQILSFDEGETDTPLYDLTGLTEVV